MQPQLSISVIKNRFCRLFLGIKHQCYKDYYHLNRGLKKPMVSLLWFFLFILMTGSSLAQRADYFKFSTQKQKGYWQVKTDPTTRVTKVVFYDEFGQIMYEEKLQGSYLKLNKRSIAALDRNLLRLREQSLVASSVKSYTLPVENQFNAASDFMIWPSDITITPSGKPMIAYASGKLSRDFTYNMFTFKNPLSLVIAIENRIGKWFKIFVKHSDGREVYTKSSNTSLFKTELLLSSLPEGHYLIRIQSEGEKRIQHFDILEAEGKKQIHLLPHLSNIQYVRELK